MSETKPNYAILRVEKMHSKRQLSACAKHNNRTSKDGLEHTDPDRPAGVIHGNGDAVQAWNDAMESKGLDPHKKPAKGAVIALEWVASASPAWWQNATEDQRADWAADTVAFIKKEAGADGNLLAVWWHDDETTPHIHAVSIPLVEKERAARGRVRAGRERPAPTKGWGLSAADLIGGSSHRMKVLQDDYAIEMSHHGLRRGVPRKETGERHKSPAKWRAEQAALTDEMKAGAQVVTDAKTIADIYRETAIATSKDLMDKAIRAVDYANGLGARVRADAKELGRAISFPAYADDPEGAEARQAIAKAKTKREEEAAAQKRHNQRAWNVGRSGSGQGRERQR